MIDELVVVDDEAWTPEELAAETAKWERRSRANESPAARERRRERRCRYAAQVRADPVRLERQRASHRRYNYRTRPFVCGSLHDLACTGPTRATGCRCSKIKLRAVLL